MSEAESSAPEKVPLAVVMISLNEAHNMPAVLENVVPWAQEVFLVDSYSSDGTVDLALEQGVQVVQRAFRGFGEQWNFALEQLPIQAPWTMKLDPDERLTPALKREIEAAIRRADADALTVQRHLWFMGRPLPIRQKLLRVWRTGSCRFSNVLVNEHPQVEGKQQDLVGELEHHDSPDLHHWYDKQNRYSTAEALRAFEELPLAAEPKLLGNSFQRRMWLKHHFAQIPFRYMVLFAYNFLLLGTWRAGWVGYAWSRLRVDALRAREYKLREMQMTGSKPVPARGAAGSPDPRVPQF